MKISYRVVLLAVISMFLCTASFAAEKDAAMIMDLKGDVQIMTGESSTWVPAKVWMKLAVRDVIKTGADSYADLGFGKLGKDALVRVDSNSSMKVASYDQVKGASKGKVMLDLAVGDILVKVDKIKDESQFQVRTPTSIVGVRGTGFRVHVSPKD